MEKEFVNYSQALALKELGFDEPCFAYYGFNNVENKLFFDIDPDDGELTSLNQNQFYHNNLSEVGRISAPLKQQVFRWFRKQGYNIKVQKESEGIYFGFYWTGAAWIIVGNGTYEEAESACIDKLIELVQSSSNEG